MILEDILREKLKNKCENNMNDYVQSVANWYAYIILNNKKYKIDHRLDPPWDNSGRVICIDEKFNLEDYVTLKDFLQKEYTGESFASYVSGHGMYHYTYEEEFEQITLEWITSQISSVIKGLIDNENVYLKGWASNKDILLNVKNTDKITEIILFDDIIGDFICSYVLQIKDHVLDTHPIILFNRGKKDARERIRKEKIKHDKK